MDFKILVNIVYKLMELESKNSDSLMGVSYILSNTLKFPSTQSIMAKVPPLEILKVVYTVFFMLTGDDYETAKDKTKNMYLVGITDIENKEYLKEKCDFCDGDGIISCYECDGSGNVECEFCDGDGVLQTNDEESDECDNCWGTGEQSCDNCDGGDVECPECGGDGEIESSELYVELTTSHWVFIDESLYKDLEELYNNERYMDEEEFFKILDDTKTKGSIILLSTKNLREETKLRVLQNEFDDNIDEGDSFISKLSSIENFKNVIVNYPGGTNTSLVYLN